MSYKLHKYYKQLSGQIVLTSSKSESNRVLIMNALSDGLLLENLSEARDTATMKRLLEENNEVWDVLDAGTTMRFCTAFLALKGHKTIITGTERMQQRPIGILVDALRELGAGIDYLKNEGYPPMQISKIKDQKAVKIRIPGNISSQYISALLMIAPCLPKGLQLELVGEIYSLPYIEMTLGLMGHFGIKHEWQARTIKIEAQHYQSNTYRVESDWSGASYWYSMAALNQDAEIYLSGLNEMSYQGDQAIAGIMETFGVRTTFTSSGVSLVNHGAKEDFLDLDFKKCPDLAQTVMVIAAAKNIHLRMTGLESLRIKETDRISAMKSELRKLGANIEEFDGYWILTPGTVPDTILPIDTYEDHRMAMAFAPLCMIRNIEIKDPDVVKKSYPGFWEDLKSVGVVIE